MSFVNRDLKFLFVSVGFTQFKLDHSERHVVNCLCGVSQKKGSGE